MLGRDKDDTKRRTRSVDGGRRSVLQDGKSLDILRQQTVQLFSIRGYAVDQDQRAAAIDGGLATDVDLCSLTRFTTGEIDVQVRDHSLQALGYIGDRTGFQLFGVDLVYRTGEVHFALHAITDNDDFLQVLGVFFKDNAKRRFSVHLDLLGLIPDKADFKHGIRRDCQVEVPVRICNRTVAAGFLDNGCTDKRFAAFIRHDTLYLDFRPDLIRNRGFSCHSGVKW